MLPFDLHVLGLPLAFILSQDQTLHCNSIIYYQFLFDPNPSFKVLRLSLAFALNNPSGLLSCFSYPSCSKNVLLSIILLNNSG